MHDAILLSHVFIQHGEEYKLDTIDLCVSHFRKHNPTSHIYLTGHGLSPKSPTLDICDGHYWQDSIIPEEINVGHPKLVNVGLEYFKEQGFTHVFKNRADSINVVNNISNYCFNIINKENTKKLITTSNDCNFYMGDLLTYGGIDFLIDCWNIETWYPTSTGLTSLGKNFIKATEEDLPWKELLKKHTSYRDPSTMNWVDFRRYWTAILKLDNYREKVLNNDFDYKYLIWDDWPYENRLTEANFYS